MALVFTFRLSNRLDLWKDSMMMPTWIQIMLRYDFILLAQNRPNQWKYYTEMTLWDFLDHFFLPKMKMQIEFFRYSSPQVINQLTCWIHVEIEWYKAWIIITNQEFASIHTLPSLSKRLMKSFSLEWNRKRDIMLLKCISYFTTNYMFALFKLVLYFNAHVILV